MRLLETCSCSRIMFRVTSLTHLLWECCLFYECARLGGLPGQPGCSEEPRSPVWMISKMGVTVLGNWKAPMHCTFQMPECQLFIKTWGNMTEMIKAPIATSWHCHQIQKFSYAATHLNFRIRESLKISVAMWAVMKDAYYLEMYCVVWLLGEDTKRTNDSSTDFSQFGPHQEGWKENITNKRGKWEEECTQGNQPSVGESWGLQ